MSLFHKLKGWLNEERLERLPWVVMAYIGGLLAYFALHGQGLYFVIALGLGTGLLGFWFKKYFGLVGLSVVSFCVGWGNMAFQTFLNAHPILEHPVYQMPIEATVWDNQILTDRQILTLGEIRWQNPDLKMPQKIRVHLKQADVFLNTGDRIKANVHVYPPTQMAGYERQLWFDKIGATGVIQGVTVKHAGSSFAVGNFLRQKINRYLFRLLPREQAEIAAALMTGSRKLVSREVYQLYRRAGIAHVLSVSGFHMALLAAFLFFMIRSLCVLFPRVVFYKNTKKVAAVLALIGTFLYLGLSGFQIPAVRAFIMIAFVFAGILMDRSVLSMRSLWLACLGILLVAPHKVLSVSFQLSFVAVMVLVAFCTWLQEKTWSRFWKFCVGFIGVNGFVYLALSPFVAYHFHQVIPYGILGNMVFNGVFSLFIMPLLFVGALFMLFGVGRPFFVLAGYGIKLVHQGIEGMADWPYAEIVVPEISSSALSLFAFGLMILCFMKTPLKRIGFLFILLGIGWAFLLDLFG